MVEEDDKLYLGALAVTVGGLAVTLIMAQVSERPAWFAWSGWLLAPALFFVIITVAMVAWSLWGLFYILPKITAVHLNRPRALRKEVAQRNWNGWPRWSKMTLERRHSKKLIEKLILNGRLVMLSKPNRDGYDRNKVYLDLPETVMIRRAEEE